MSNRPAIRHRKRGQKGTHPLLVHFKGRGRGGVINECKRPDLGASKADLAEFHQEEMRLRRAGQLARQRNRAWPPASKSADPDYRKSIWPAATIARRRACAAPG